jgi:hypothetical protein
MFPFMPTTIRVTVADNIKTINFEVSDYLSARLINNIVHSDPRTAVLYT